MATSGIFLAVVPDDPGFSVMLELGGQRSRINNNDITFVIPSFISAELAGDLLDTVMESDLRLAAIQELRSFSVQVEQAVGEITARGVQDIHARLTSDSREARAVKVTPIGALAAIGFSKKETDKTRAVVLNLAMHQILMGDSLHFMADGLSHRTSAVFTLRPQSHVTEYGIVRDWSRNHSKEMKSFAVKAAKARAWGEHHPPSLIVGNELEVRSEEEVGVRWDKNDQMILRFLNRSLGQGRLIQDHPFMVIAPSILKAVDDVSALTPDSKLDRYALIGRERIMSFLSEIGVVAPWENWVVREEEAALLEWTSRDPRPRPAPKKSSSPSTLSSTEFYPLDPHDAVRKDFGRLAVYTIDDAGAAELDDGVSIEPAAPTASGIPTYWIHVHIADPTSLLHPRHDISLVAKSRDCSEYFPERTWSMLPSWFIRGKGLSLGTKLGNEEEKTLTMSSRVDATGEIIETDIKAGIVRTVKRFTYGAVDTILRAPERMHGIVLHEPLLVSDYKLSSTFSPSRLTDDATLKTDTTALTDLPLLHSLASALLRRRVAADALFWTFARSSVNVSPSIDYAPLLTDAPRFYSTSPTVSLTLPTTGASSMSPAQVLVSELMILANRNAARFCVERNIPVPFRGQPTPKGPPGALERALKERDPITGEISGAAVMKEGLNFVGATETVDPQPHAPMGITDPYGYVKVTSPLRRYHDMLAHWQIKSALLSSSSAGSTAPYTRTAVLSSIRDSQNVQKGRGRASKNAELFWSLYVLDKKFRNPDLDPVATQVLSNLTALALRNPTFNTYNATWVQNVTIPELGISAQLTTKDEADGVLTGESANVKLSEISLSNRSRAIVTMRH